MNVVVDASAALKWFLRSRDDEANLDIAPGLLRRVADGSVTLLQPPHLTADERYWRRARTAGCIVRLADFACTG